MLDLSDARWRVIATWPAWLFLIVGNDIANASPNLTGYFLRPLLSCRDGESKIVLISRFYRNPPKQKTKIFDIRASGRVNRRLYSFIAQVDSARSASGPPTGTPANFEKSIFTLKNAALDGELRSLSLPSLSIWHEAGDADPIQLQLDFAPIKNIPAGWAQFKNCTREDGWPYLLEAL